MHYFYSMVPFVSKKKTIGGQRIINENIFFFCYYTHKVHNTAPVFTLYTATDTMKKRIATRHISKLGTNL